jgi:hypothetical protein
MEACNFVLCFWACKGTVVWRCTFPVSVLLAQFVAGGKTMTGWHRLIHSQAAVTHICQRRAFLKNDIV